MYEVSAHRIQKVRILIDNVLIIEKEFVGLQQLLLLDHQLIRIFIILHNLIILHIIVWDSLSAKHDQGVFINHVESYEPYAPIDDRVEHYPGVPLDV